MNGFNEIRSQLNQATADLAKIRERCAALLSELNDLEPKEAELSGRAASLTAELQRLEPPTPRPEDVERLAGFTKTLSAKLGKLPTRSPTGARVRGQLERLDDESVTVSDRLNLCRGLLSDVDNAYQLDRQIWDAAEGRAAQRLR